jgi:hypothetical protein
MAAVLCEHRVEPMRGFEPPSTSYKDAVLPLNYIGMVVVDGIEPSHHGVSDRCLTYLATRHWLWRIELHYRYAAYKAVALLLGYATSLLRLDSNQRLTG